MKLIVAIPYAPWPIRQGTDRLIMNLLNGLASRHDVVLVTIALSRGELERLHEIERPRIAVRAILAPNRKSVLHRAFYKVRNSAAAALAGVPAQVSYAAPEQFLKLIAATAANEKADLVFASYWHLYRLPDRIAGARLALVTHDLDFVVNPGRLGALGGIARFTASLRLRALERIERKAYERYDTILTMTPSDAEVLARYPVAAGKTIRALPLALDLSEFNPGAFSREKDKVLFVGSFYSDFNRDALRYFIARVLPLVLAKKPGARLEVVGQGVTDDVRLSAGPGVSFTGGVDDIKPYLGSCAVMVLPLRFCGGVRIRMMEAAAMGTPVVSTPVGVAGMGLAAGKDYVEAVSSEELAQGILRLLDDGEEAARVGANARRWAEATISMESYPKRLDELLDIILSGTPGPRRIPPPA